MLTLTPNEARVLGTMVEKAQTVPASYPITLNALTNGCNQKNNRNPITELDEDTVYDALDTLRRKGVVREVMLTGSRVQKFRHTAREAFSVSTEELVLLSELLLRGPQSIGELRGHASRMVPTGLESLEAAQGFLDALAKRPEPFVKLVPPPAGSRAALYVQLLCPDLHPIVASTAGLAPTAPAAVTGLEQRVAALEAEVARLRTLIEQQLG
ncbi:MAG: YceH family protein [Phycisphaerales bacterium]